MPEKISPSLILPRLALRDKRVQGDKGGKQARKDTNAERSAAGIIMYAQACEKITGGEG